jgi:O-antigen/teichoic acid export membrane protein
MNVFQATLYSLQLWIRTGWRPVFLFDKYLFRHHFNFGYKLTLSGLIDTVYQNFYTLIIGKFFSAAQAGYYTYSMTLRQLPIQNISGALNKVSYPVFSSIQHDDIRLKRAYKKLMQQAIFWVAPILILLSIVAEPLFRFLLTEKWLPAAPYFQILCWAGILYPLQFYNLNILKVKGRSDLFLRLEIIKKVYSVIGVFCILRFGIYALLYFLLITTIVSFVINTWYSGKLINYPMREQLKDIAPTILLAAFLGVVVWYINFYLQHYFGFSDILQLLITASIYALAYLLTSYCINISSLKDFRQLILKR